MTWAIIGKVAAVVAPALITGIMGNKGGGVGAAASASVQPGQTGLQYQDVAGTGITPFEYPQEYQEQLAEEDEQRQMADAMAQAQQQGLWSGGLISLMQGGPLYANQGLEIEDYFPDIEFDPTAISSDLTDPLSEPGDELEEILGRQEIRDTIAEEGIGLLTKLLVSKIKDRNTSPSVSARRSITPLPGKGGGGRAARQERQREGTLGITPFTYQGGGEVLGRSMFAQNYMPQGGAMQGPGGPKSDLIPVMASDGEYMLSKAAVDQAGGGNHARGIANLEQFNNTGNRRYG